MTCDLGFKLSRRGILVVKDPENEETRKKKTVPGLVGMNIISSLKDKITDNDFKPNLSEQWKGVLELNVRESLSSSSTSAIGFPKVAGKGKVRVPAKSAIVVQATGLNGGE